jgi:signal transduction histidine kinase
LGRLQRGSGLESIHTPRPSSRPLRALGPRRQGRPPRPAQGAPVVLSGGPLAEAAETIHKLFASILGDAPTRVSVMEADRLSPVVTTGWATFQLDNESHRDIATLPLLSNGSLVGLVDVIAPGEIIEESRDILDAAARQGAALLESVAGRSDSSRGSDPMFEEDSRERQMLGGVDEMVHVFENLLRCTTPEDVIRSLTSFCTDHHQAPIAAWLRHGDETRFSLVSCRGLGTKGYHELRDSMRTIRSDEVDRDNHRQLVSRFVTIADAHHAHFLDLGEILVIWGEAGIDADARIGALARYVGSLLSHLSAIKRGELCSERLDEGIALTAHEMKSPVFAAMAAIDFVIGSDKMDERRRHLLAASRQELGKLSELVDSLLSSANDNEDEELVETNLADLVQEAAESCSWESGEGRVTVDSPSEVPVRGEVSQLRAAVKNMIRTALTYTPGGGKVSVRVTDDEGLATVSVRDHGPTAPAEELSAIFDPVLRSEKTGSRAGRTLGLVVTKRVALALGGRVWAETRPNGAAIHFQLPLSA